MKTFDPPKIVSLAQLMLMPVGTVVSPLKQSINQLAHFNCQGALELNPQAVLYYVSEDSKHIVLDDVLPELFIVEGNVGKRPSRTHYFKDSQFPFRFVVWSSPE